MKQRAEVTQSDRPRPEPLLVAPPPPAKHHGTCRPPQPPAGPRFGPLSPRTSGARRPFVLPDTAAFASVRQGSPTQRREDALALSWHHRERPLTGTRRLPSLITGSLHGGQQRPGPAARSQLQGQSATLSLCCIPAKHSPEARRPRSATSRCRDSAQLPERQQARARAQGSQAHNGRLTCASSAGLDPAFREEAADKLLPSYRKRGDPHAP